MSHFIRKTRITKNLDIIQIFVAHSFQECQESRGPLLIDDFIVTRLFWKFWLFNNPLSKNIIRMFTSNFFYYLKHQYFVNQSTQSTPLLSKFRPKKNKIFCVRSNLVYRVIRIRWIRWWYLLFLFSSESTQSTLFMQIWSKMSKLPVWTNILLLVKSEYTEYDGDNNFLCFRSKVIFSNKIVSLR